jgi:deoxyribodipyrimidine photolyase-like uncharacterized protein
MNYPAATAGYREFRIQRHITRFMILSSLATLFDVRPRRLAHW